MISPKILYLSYLHPFIQIPFVENCETITKSIFFSLKKKFFVIEKIMDTPHFLSLFFGIYFVIIGIVAFLRREFFRSVIENLFHNPALIAFSGVISLMGGILVLLFYHEWNLNHHVAITILGYLFVLGGIARLMFPEKLHAWALHIVRGNGFYVMAAINLILGLWLCWTS